MIYHYYHKTTTTTTHRIGDLDLDKVCIDIDLFTVVVCIQIHDPITIVASVGVIFTIGGFVGLFDIISTLCNWMLRHVRIINIVGFLGLVYKKINELNKISQLDLLVYAIGN